MSLFTLRAIRYIVRTIACFVGNFVSCAIRYISRTIRRFVYILASCAIRCICLVIVHFFSCGDSLLIRFRTRSHFRSPFDCSHVCLVTLLFTCTIRQFGCAFLHVVSMCIVVCVLRRSIGHVRWCSRCDLLNCRYILQCIFLNGPNITVGHSIGGA